MNIEKEYVEGLLRKIERLQDERDSLSAQVEMAYPDFLLELSRKLNEQPSRATAHPFYQVRCKQPYVTMEGYNSEYFEVVSDDGVIFSSGWKNRGCNDEYFAEYLIENHHEWLCDTFEGVDVIDVDFLLENYDFDKCENLPCELTKIWIQEVEEVVSTHLTIDDAEAFIKRKQHDYPKLYTYAESAYWSLEFRKLQDWLKSLTAAKLRQGGAE